VDGINPIGTVDADILSRVNAMTGLSNPKNLQAESNYYNDAADRLETARDWYLPRLDADRCVPEGSASRSQVRDDGLLQASAL